MYKNVSNLIRWWSVFYWCRWRGRNVFLYVCVWSAGYLRPVFGPLFLPKERKWSWKERCIWQLRAVICDIECIVLLDWLQDPTSLVVLSTNSFLSSCESCLLRICWAMAWLWLTVLLRNRRGQICSARRIEEKVVIREDAFMKRASTRSGQYLTVLVGA